MARVKKKERHTLLMRQVSEKPFLTDEELAKLLEVSIQTIRLDRMELGIPEVRERIRRVAEEAREKVTTIEKDDLVGELIDLQPGRSGISLLKITEDMVIDVHYVQESHTITIIYRDLDGQVIYETTTTTAVAGDEYRINAPAIPGYVSLQQVITGEMPSRDMQITLFYAKENETETETIPVVSSPAAQLPDGSVLIEDYGIPLGLGSIGLNQGICVE